MYATEKHQKEDLGTEKDINLPFYTIKTYVKNI